MQLQEALLALKNKDFAAARARIGEIDPAFGIQHFLVKGLAELAMQDWDAAFKTFSAATGRFPDHAAFWFNRGIAAENLNLTEHAIASQEQCLRLTPNNGDAKGNLSNLYRLTRNFDQAEAMARQALSDNASKADALNSLGLALWKQGKFEDAGAIFQQAHQAAPENPAILANNANLQADLLNFDAAWHLFAAARAIKDDPLFRRDEGMTRLLARDFDKGWHLFESRLELPNALRLRPGCPRWNGEDLKNKKLLIIAEQGLGDVIQFCRYQQFLPDGDLVWAVPKSLMRLLAATVRGTVINETAALPDCDFHIPVMSLPYATRQTHAAPLPFTAPQNPRLPPTSAKTKIGLIWAGSRTHLRDDERSLPLKLFAPLIDCVSADFYAPFIGQALDEIGDLPITRLDTLITDFADTAALLKQLDYVITVDTAVAHLAGSLGIKTLLLLSYCPDWRWGTQGETTPWYPSMTLARQKTPGDWQSALENALVLLKRGFGKTA